MTGDDVAKWFVIGFARCWKMQGVIEAAGIVLDGEADVRAMHAQCPWMPSNPWECYGRSGGMPVRAFVAREFPRLHAYLDRNHGNAEKLAAAIPQVLKLKSKGLRTESIHSKGDLKEHRAVSNQLRRVTTANRAARAQQLSHQRGAWNICKK